MSVINKVLKDLDRQGATASSLAGVQAVQSSPTPARPFWPWLVLVITALAAAGWFWSAAKGEAPTAAPEVQEARPRLRLSEALSSPAPTGKGARAVAATSEPGKTKPPHEIQPPAPTRSTDAAPPMKPLPFAGRLDTRLPEPRPSRVVKEVRPLTPQEQADQAWRQAARLVEQGRGREALAGLETALRLDPSHGAARQTLIALSLEAGDAARGETLLREGMQLHADDAWYNRSLAQIYLQRGDARQSVAILKAGLGKGVDAAYWGLYAGVLGKSGRHEEAAQAYREAARLNPEHGPWWIGLAVSLEQTGQRPDAASAYQRALQTRLSPEVREFAARKAGELAPSDNTK